ncbi:SDR family NAD(P)-dependent oxidoreductase [Kitasatospora sp. NPDC101155]|uniref:SDR family NAD(P)-dependent oxidoreductase n=1 Tax=Kitasatospora sp. NPDC101155 TaxID=3364097 RepID=UPI0037FD462F
MNHVREPVRFADTIATMDAGILCEIGPDAVLTPMIEDRTAIATLRKDQDEPTTLLKALSQLHTTGVPVNWPTLLGGSGQHLDLPTYPFQHQRYWLPAGPGLPAAGVLPAPQALAEPPADLLELVRLHAAAVLGHADAAEVPAYLRFQDIGFGSLAAMQLRDSLSAAVGRRLPATIVFDYPTPAALARFLDSGALAEAPVVIPAALDEPIAIVGMACRLPGGVRSPEELWRLVTDGVDVMAPFPTDRGWELDPAYRHTREGGFLYDAAEFDADFFGISPREALAMDPQQRLLLETSWEAFERAQIDPLSLAGSRTGVFVGLAGNDYQAMVRESAAGSGFGMTGNSSSVASGRIAYTLGLEGPAVTVDTACSSSLVALHLAAQALRGGECSLALAGGATVMSTSEAFEDFAQQGGLAADGRCKAFADAADGTGWGEGVGLVLLERLSDARRHGHQVLAVVRGSAINQDGASNGLTAPNGPSQQRVIRQALANARLTADQVDAVEAHGTGTSLGDPIEAQALLATYGQDRETPLLLGSLKSNIGHTMAAAGVAGIIKMVQAMRHGVLPRTLHADQPSTHVDWAAGAVELLTEQRDWPELNRPRRAAVSSFGMSGTNAHVILEQVAEPVPVEAAEVPPVLPFVLSARTEPALRAQAERLREWHVGLALPAAEVGRALALGRARLPHRAVVIGGTPEDFADGLAALAAGGVSEHLVQGVARAADGAGPVFVFPGQGSQWAGMGTELLRTSPAFRAAMARCEAALAPYVDWSLTEAIADDALLERVDVVQPALFAVMVSLAEVWRSCGVEPAAVLGHSQGEIAAACVAGALSLEDAARVVALRSRLIGSELAGQGGMVSVAVSAQAVQELLDRWPGRLALAAVNGPTSVVLAGDADAVQELLDVCEAEQLRARRVPVDYPSHSPHVERIQAELLTALETVAPRPAQVPFWSTVTGGLLDTTELTGEYWYRNLRQTVRFEETVRALASAGHTVFVETSAHPVATVGVEETLGSCGVDGVVTGTLRRKTGDAGQFITALATLGVHGTEPDWSAVFGPATGRRVALPTYAFQRRRFWPERIERGSRARTVTDDWRYRVAWQSLTQPTTADRTGKWLVALPARVAGEEAVATLLEALAAAGREVLPLVLDAVDPEQVRQQAAGAVGVLSLLTWDEQPDADHPSVPHGYALTVSLIQALGGVEVPLWCVTRDAVRVADSDLLGNPGQALVWGLGRVLGLEHPERWGGVVDLPAALDPRTAELFARTLGSTGDEDQWAVRPAGVFVRRMVRANPYAEQPDWRPSGTVLVTGGTGALGAKVARWLAGNGAEHLVLTSRRGERAEGAAELAAEIAELGARVTIAACDVADREALSALLAGLPGELTTVVHAAGVLDDGLIESLTADQLERALSAKMTAAHNLHELTRDRELSAFVLFSSAGATAGAPGQGNYAPGNAYLDALAQHRQALGLPATSVAWGAWDGSGMATGAVKDLLRRHGVPAIDPELALTVLQQALNEARPMVLVADIEWPRYHVAFTAVRPSPMFDEIPEVRQLRAAEPQESVASGSALQQQLAALSEPEREQLLLDLVRAHSALVLGHSAPDAVAADRAFRELGLDSVTAVELRNRLNTATGLRLPATLVFDFPTPTALAGYLRGELGGGAAAPVEQAQLQASGEPVAIVGMACRYPGGVASPEDLWRLVSAGRDAISAFPTDRGWQAGEGRGGFLYDAGEFDGAFFGISPREAVAMDPQQRLLLETSWEALERAGIAPASLQGSRTGVFAGIAGSDYSTRFGSADPDSGGYLMTGNAPSIVSGRIAYTLGLEGPAITVDTACSSSLVALHLAAQALRGGECSLALAGGVTVMASPLTLAEFSRQGGLAADGRVKAFAEAADGTGMAEGAGVLVLERLADAERNGHRVLAVVRGSAVNQDGASNGLTAPNGPSQQRVIRQALANAQLTPGEVDAVEAHGTGTTLGDPIEAQALLATYGQDREQPLLLGSVKSNIGHAQAAAGVAGIIKMVMAMRHGMLPPTLHVDAPSSHVDWSAGAVELLTESQDWPELDRPRRAAVSSFGISGTNAHVVLEQAPPAEPAPVPEAGPVVPVVLSARTDAALRAQAERLLPLADADPGELGWSLAATRSPMPHRAVVLTRDRAALADGLAALAAGERAPQLVAGPPVPGRLGVLFTGQGAQRIGMGGELYRHYPAFATALDEVCAELDRHLDRPIREVMLDQPELLDRTCYTQPALFALEVALYRFLDVSPDYLAGHSIGELAAAHLAGVLSLPDAAVLVTARGQLMQELPADGAMLSVQATEAEVADWLVAQDLPLDIAAVNGPRAVVVSGGAEAVAACAEHFAGAGRKTKQLAVSHAFHSALMEPMLAEFAEVAAGLEFRRPRIPIVSTVTGKPVPAERIASAEYWVEQVRGTVRFADAVRSMAEAGVGTFLEVGPDAVLSALGPDCLPAGAEALFVPALRDQRSEPETALTALAQLYRAGTAIDWTARFGERSGPGIELPTYPFQRERYWYQPVAAPSRRAGDDWRYRIAWQPLTGQRPAVLSGRWLLLAEGAAEADAAAVALRRAGAKPTTWLVGPEELTRDQLAARLASAAGGFAGVLALPGRSELAGTVALLQALGDAEVGAPLWVATRGAVAVGAEEPLPNPEQARLWGFGRVAGLEYPQRWGGLVDLPELLDEPAGELLAAALAGLDDEDQLAIRDGGLFARRLVRAPQDAARAGAAWQPHGTVLITGGTGALGGHVARWLARAGAEHLVLASRRGPLAPGATELAQELTRLGTQVTVVACDAADREALAQTLAAIPVEMPLTGVVHTAGVLENLPIDQLTPQALRASLWSKTVAARNLHELTVDQKLELFVLFSSVSGVWGSSSQGAYAAANAYLDALAQHRRAAGLAGLSVAWGAWDGGGMAAGDGAEWLRRRGVTPMAPEQAVAALAAALDQDETAVAVADMDWTLFAPSFTLNRPSPLIEQLPEVRQVLDATPEPKAAPVLAGLSGPERKRALLGLVLEQVAAILGYGSTEVAAGASFRELGFDSLAAVEMRNALKEATGQQLPPTLVFDHPTPGALADHLDSLLRQESADEPRPVLDQLDQLEQALARIGPDDALRSKIATRLRGLTLAWDTDQQSGVAVLETASDDELFDFINSEFGRE